MSERIRDVTVAPPPATPSSSLIRPTFGLLAGLGITALIAGLGIIIATLAMLRGVADPKTFVQSQSDLLVYLAIIGVGTFAGGWATSRITAGRSFFTVFVLALILFMSAVVVVFRGSDGPARPQWYLLSQAAIVLVSSLLGGYLERRGQARAREG